MCFTAPWGCDLLHNLNYPVQKQKAAFNVH